MQVDQASLGLSREYLISGFDEPFVGFYHNYQVDLAELFGANRADAELEMSEVLEFEFKLADVSFIFSADSHLEILQFNNFIYPMTDFNVTRRTKKCRTTL